ncbi:MAG: trypsin-like peptidase domain-containing protein [Candidatus Paceibacterota bacterium]
MNNKKFIISLVFVALVGGIFGSLVFSQPVKASFFGDLYNQYIKPFAVPFSGSTAPTAQTQTQIYSPTVDYEAAVVKAIEQTSPAVISITISKNLPVIEQCPYNPFANMPPEVQQLFGDQNVQFYQQCQKGTSLQEIGGGSGFIVSSDGLIVTNKHVVYDEAASYTVLTNDGKKYDAKVLARDPNRDVAIIKISATDLPVVNLGDSDGLKLGQTAIAIGNALGEFRNTVSTGVISGLSRNITASGSGGIGTEKLEDLIQTDAAINEGNSGGPLLNLKGEVIGINVAMVSGAQSIGFSIPINQVKKSIESVKSTGRIVSPYLGVRYLVITSDLAKKEKLSVDSGVIVRGSSAGPAVLKNSPAEKAGLKAEDIITEVNGEKITQDKSLNSLLQKYSVGDTITLKALRDGKEMEIKVVLEERPAGI